MTRVGRAIEKGETNGLMKIVVDANSQEILGAAVFGTGGDEVIHCVLDAMYAKAPYPVLQRAMHIHPTVSELIPTILEELAPPAPRDRARICIPTRRLGSTELMVSRIGLGLAALGRPAYINLGRQRDFGSERSVADTGAALP